MVKQLGWLLIAQCIYPVKHECYLGSMCQLIGKFDEG